MAMEAGVLTLVLDFAADLKDVQWFGRQDPYCRVRVGNQEFKSKTAKDGGKNPVWNETFRFNIINENEFIVVVADDNTVSDDIIGRGVGTLARVRGARSDCIKIPIKGKEHQHGFVQVTLQFTPNSSMMQPAAGYPQQPAPPPYYPPQPYYPPPQAPPPQQYYQAPPPQPPPQYAYVQPPPPQVVYHVAPPPPQQVVYYSQGHHGHHSHHGHHYF